MKKINLPKFLLTVFVTTGITIISITFAYAYGEGNCYPYGSLTGICTPNSEGIFHCVPANGAYNCSEY